MPDPMPQPIPDLLIGDRAYSSWSLRGWLLFDAFGIPVKTTIRALYSESLRATLAEWAPARTVPAVRFGEGIVVSDSLAIAEELATRHPDAGVWPADPARRAIARHLAAEMHSSFGALRSHCPMNLRVSYADCQPTEAVLADTARIERLWAWALEHSGGPWLCGAYSAADVFYAPVAARIAGYGLPVSARAQAYVDAHLAHPSFRRWRAMALVAGPDQPVYRRDYPQRPWPGPAPLPAEACDGPAINAACPYSGKTVTHFLRVQGRVLGFCNAYCRDKTLADPQAWPQAMALLEA